MLKLSHFYPFPALGQICPVMMFALTRILHSYLISQSTLELRQLTVCLGNVDLAADSIVQQSKIKQIEVHKDCLHMLHNAQCDIVTYLHANLQVLGGIGAISLAH